MMRRMVTKLGVQRDRRRIRIRKAPRDRCCQGSKLINSKKTS